AGRQVACETRQLLSPPCSINIARPSSCLPPRAKFNFSATEERSSQQEMADCEGKSEWPELVGFHGDEAVGIIERENPLVEASTTTRQITFVSGFEPLTKTKIWLTKVYVNGHSP
ncbi:hypothetical protein Taro_030564, partial [Colocasia esculenta]|nr:hypothetical protein [Colocasia esculenta]